MAVAVASSASDNFATITDGGGADINYTVSKPSGVAVGDLLVAIIARDIGDYGTDTPPSGWTVILRTDNATGYKLTTYYKIATSTEVAASNFIFSNVNTASSNMAAGAVVLRITGHSAGTPIWTSAGDGSVSNTANPTFANTITPAVASSLILLIAAGRQNNNAIGGYAVATDDPTWTEIFDFTATPGADAYSMSIATATRTAVTATGNSSVTGGDATADWAAQLIAIPPDKSYTQTDTITSSEPANSYLRGRIFSQTDTVTSSETITSAMARAWSNLSKSVTTWINQDKS